MKIDSFKPSLPPPPPPAAAKVGVGLDDDISDGMQCTDHPYRTNPGGICAFCLQEKLGKLVSSSLPLPIRGSSSSPSSPSLGSDNNSSINNNVNGSVPSNAGSISKTVNFNVNGVVDCHFHHDNTTKRARIPFLLAKKKKKVVMVGGAEYNRTNDVVFKRSKSTTAPRRGQFLVDGDDGVDFSPRKHRGGFWSFLYYHAPSSSKSHAPRKVERVATSGGGGNLGVNDTILEEDESPNGNATSFERKVSRSRSVGCGSRSFSGDFFERISTGFGDCTLRRVESQRESKSSKVSTNGNSSSHRNGAGVDHHCIKERVKCGGLFSGFMMTSSSSSSSSSSYLVSSSSADELTRKPTPVVGPVISGGRSRTWTWAFASPMRAFKPSNSKDRKRSIIRQATESNPSPDLNSIPSLLTVRS
ncbi:hypothetical protein IC582_026989 [Cucumis melo]